MPDFFPVYLLSKIVEMGIEIRQTKNCHRYNLPENVQLLSTLGDVQASLLPVLKNNEAGKF